MGGTGSGRRPDPMKRLLEFDKPQPQYDDTFILPNPSAVQDAALKTSSAIAGGVSSVFGRSGVVVAVANDYTLDQIDDPAGAVAFSMGSNDIKWQFSNPASNGFEIEAIGAYSGDLAHIHQHTGNPGAVNLLTLEAADTDVTLFRAVGTGEVVINHDGSFYSSATISGAAFVSGASTPLYYTDSQVDHDNITNTHNLTTDIDHDALTNYVSTQHEEATIFELSGAVTVSGAIATQRTDYETAVVSGAVTSGATTAHINLTNTAHGNITTQTYSAETSGLYAVTSGAYIAHAADASDPHGVTLTQTNLVLTSGSTPTDADASGAALFRNILIGTEASPGAASNWAQGTSYFQYTA